MSLGILIALIFGYFILGTITLAVYHVINGYDRGGVVIVTFWPLVCIIGIFIGTYLITYKLVSRIKGK